MNILILICSILYIFAALAIYDMIVDKTHISYDGILMCLIMFMLTPMGWWEYKWFAVALMVAGISLVGFLLIRELINKLKEHANRIHSRNY